MTRKSRWRRAMQRLQEIAADLLRRYKVDLDKARAEFEKATRDEPYTTPLPEETPAPRFPNPARGVG